jgi:hypothetical protein
MRFHSPKFPHKDNDVRKYDDIKKAYGNWVEREPLEDVIRRPSRKSELNGELLSGLLRQRITDMMYQMTRRNTRRNISHQKTRRQLGKLLQRMMLNTGTHLLPEDIDM